jgi:hypothetical protein
MYPIKNLICPYIEKKKKGYKLKSGFEQPLHISTLTNVNEHNKASINI